MAEAKWGTVNPIPYNETGCGILHVTANGTFEYTNTNNKIDEQTIKINLLNNLQNCINEGKYETYNNMVAGNKNISQCVINSTKVDGVTIDKFTFYSLNVSKNDKEKYDKCISGETTIESNEQNQNQKSQKSATTTTETIIDENNKTNNDSFFGNNILLILGVIVIAFIVLFIIIKKKKPQQPVNNTQESVQPEQQTITQTQSQQPTQQQQTSDLQNMFTAQTQQENNNDNNNNNII